MSHAAYGHACVLQIVCHQWYSTSVITWTIFFSFISSSCITSCPQAFNRMTLAWNLSINLTNLWQQAFNASCQVVPITSETIYWSAYAVSESLFLAEQTFQRNTLSFINASNYRVNDSSTSSWKYSEDIMMWSNQQKQFLSSCPRLLVSCLFWCPTFVPVSKKIG